MFTKNLQKIIFYNNVPLFSLTSDDKLINVFNHFRYLNFQTKRRFEIDDVVDLLKNKKSNLNQIINFDFISDLNNQSSKSNFALNHWTKINENFVQWNKFLPILPLDKNDQSGKPIEDVKIENTIGGLNPGIFAAFSIYQNNLQNLINPCLKHLLIA